MIHDFEIAARLRARALECRVLPAPETQVEGEVELARQERWLGAPRGLEAGRRYADVVTERSLLGRMRVPPADGQATRRSRKLPNSRPRKVARPR